MKEIIQFLLNPQFIYNKYHIIQYDKLAELLAGLISFIAIIAKTFQSLINKIRKAFENRRVYSKLANYYTYDDVINFTKNYIEQTVQPAPPTEGDEPIKGVWTRDKIIQFFLKQCFIKNPKQKYFIVLADSGMGKTSFMINLYSRYYNKLFRKYEILLIPLGDPQIDSVLGQYSSYINAPNTILLLDAFDEDINAIGNYTKRLDEIFENVKKFKIVIITCRTQFFPIETDGGYWLKVINYGPEKGYFSLQKVYISPFDDIEIRDYINKKYGKINILNRKKRKRSYEVINKAPSLMVRPMLLNYIDDLLGRENKYFYVYEIYEELVNKWIQREARIIPKYIEDKASKSFIKRYEEIWGEKTYDLFLCISGVFSTELYHFSRQAAINIYNNRKLRNGQFYIEKNRVEEFAKRNGLKLKEWQLTGRSLLNRDSAGNLKFAHKSILEYFIAIALYEHDIDPNYFDFQGMDQTQLFYNEMKHKVKSQDWKDKINWENII